MFKNAGKILQIFAIVLAALCFVALLGIAVVFLIATTKAADEVMRTAGIQGTILFGVLALLLPNFAWIPYTLGALLLSCERREATEREVRDMLKKALQDGALSDEIARKTGLAISKITPPAAAAPRAGIAPTRPTLRTAPVAAQEPQGEAPAAPAAQAPAAQPIPPVQEKAPVAPAPAAAPVPSAAPFTPADGSAVKPISPFGTETLY